MGHINAFAPRLNTQDVGGAMEIFFVPQFAKPGLLAALLAEPGGAQLWRNRSAGHDSGNQEETITCSVSICSGASEFSSIQK